MELLSLFLSQYFEYSSQKELRHNIGKQLCLEASGRGEPVKLELCQRKGKGTSLAPSQEWMITEVSSRIKEKKEVLFCVMLKEAAKMC